MRRVGRDIIQLDVEIPAGELKRLLLYFVAMDGMTLARKHDNDFFAILAIDDSNDDSADLVELVDTVMVGKLQGVIGPEMDAGLTQRAFGFVNVVSNDGIGIYGRRFHQGQRPPQLR